MTYWFSSWLNFAVGVFMYISYLVTDKEQEFHMALFCLVVSILCELKAKNTGEYK
jgi:hypothetical protein